MVKEREMNNFTILTGYFALVLQVDPNSYREKISAFIRVPKPKPETNFLSSHSIKQIYLFRVLKYTVQKVSSLFEVFLLKWRFPKNSLKTVGIRVKFGSSKEKIKTRRMYIYLIPDTKYQELNKCIFSTCSF